MESRGNKKLTQSDLDKIHAELSKDSTPIHHDKKGRPCYSLWFMGTKNEARKLERKMKALE